MPTCASRVPESPASAPPPCYDATLRSFLPFVDDDPHGIRVMPVRYSAYIAVQLKGDAERFGPMDFQVDLDPGLDFWVPVHKLFNGSQCLEGLNLTVTLGNHQINEKLRHVHLRHSGTGWQEPQISQPPSSSRKILRIGPRLQISAPVCWCLKPEPGWLRPSNIRGSPCPLCCLPIPAAWCTDVTGSKRMAASKT